LAVVIDTLASTFLPIIYPCYYQSCASTMSNVVKRFISHVSWNDTKSYAKNLLRKNEIEVKVKKYSADQGIDNRGAEYAVIRCESALVVLLVSVTHGLPEGLNTRGVRIPLKGIMSPQISRTRMEDILPRGMSLFESAGHIVCHSFQGASCSQFIS
jgi:hypothetical protein